LSVIIKNREYRDTQEGYLKNLLLSARKHARNMKKNGRLDAGVYQLTNDDIFSLWEIQKGLCYYSKIPMVTKNALTGRPV